MLTLQNWIPQGPTTLDVVTLLKARACEALLAVLRSRRRPVAAESRLMRRGAERC